MLNYIEKEKADEERHRSVTPEDELRKTTSTMNKASTQTSMTVKMIALSSRKIGFKLARMGTPLD